jgi:hypothetical protein
MAPDRLAVGACGACTARRDAVGVNAVKSGRPRRLSRLRGSLWRSPTIDDLRCGPSQGGAPASVIAAKEYALHDATYCGHADLMIMRRPSAAR